MASSHLLHHFFRPPTFFFASLTTTSTVHPLRTFFIPSRPLSLRPCLFFKSSLSSSSFLSVQNPSSSISHPLDVSESDLYSEDDEEQFELQKKRQPLSQEEEEEKVKEPGELRIVGNRLDAVRSSNVLLKSPSLTVKEKKELAAYAHSLGKKLKSQQVGKSGVTSSVAASFVENLESNELLKLKIHNSCPGELADVVKQLEEATGSVAVGQIGRVVILYRPSLTKLKAEEKKNQFRKIYTRKRLTMEPAVQKQGQVMRLSGRGRRGSSRYESQ